MMMMIYCRTV